MARGSVKAEAITPIVNMENCTLCGLCARVCPYSAITVDKKLKKTGVVEAACAGCGTCSARGAAAVLVAGCHLGDCHYINANYQTKRRVEKLWKKMERLGLDENRLQLAWITAAEGEKLASKIKEMQSIVDKVGKEEIEKTIAAFS